MVVRRVVSQPIAGSGRFLTFGGWFGGFLESGGEDSLSVVAGVG